MRDEYDFSDAIKNPFAESIRKNGYTIMVHHDTPDGGWDEIKKVKPEDIEAEICENFKMFEHDNKEAAQTPA